jgi:hypothetical protein
MRPRLRARVRRWSRQTRQTPRYRTAPKIAAGLAWCSFEEESGRLELIRSGVVGRHAPLAAALAVTSLANLRLGMLVAAGLAAL